MHLRTRRGITQDCEQPADSGCTLAHPCLLCLTSRWLASCRLSPKPPKHIRPGRAHRLPRAMTSCPSRSASSNCPATARTKAAFMRTMPLWASVGIASEALGRAALQLVCLPSLQGRSSKGERPFPKEVCELAH